MSLTTARPYMPATCLVKRFPSEIAKYPCSVMRKGSCSPCTAVRSQSSSTPHSPIFFLANCTTYIQTKFVSLNPHVAFLALEASVVLTGSVLSANSRSSQSWRVSELGRVISFLTTRPLDYYSRLIEYSVSFKCLRCVVRKTDFAFPANEYCVIFAVEKKTIA